MSIHPHSSDASYFIFCVGQDLVTINAFTSAMVNQGITVKPIFGQYNGQAERSFLARMSDYNAIEPWLNDEESILHIHGYDSRDHPKATLLFLKEGRREELGRMYPVSREVALAHDSWSYDPWYNNYFICR